MIRDFIGSGVSEEGPNKNVINILRLLTEDPDSTLYIPYNYVASKLDRSSDPRVHFPPKESGRPMKVVTLTSNQERFNFSVTCLADVKVEYPTPEGLTKLLDKKVWRTYSIIKDGKLYVDKMAVELSEDAYSHLIDLGVLMLGDTKISTDYEYDPTAVYTLDLSDIPLISSNWARPNVLGFHKMLLDCQRTSDMLKQAKKMLKESKPADIQESSADGEIYQESIQYHGSAKGEKVECVTYTILENPGYTESKYNESDYKAIQKDVNTLSSKLEDMRFKCACIKWAIESAKSHRKSSYEWSDVYQKKAGTSKFYQDAVVDIDGVPYRLQRCNYQKVV